MEVLKKMTEAETDYIYSKLVKIEHLVQDLSLDLYNWKKDDWRDMSVDDHERIDKMNKILHEAEFKLVDCMKANTEGLKQDA